MSRYSKQPDPNVQRLGEEVDRDIRRLQQRTAALESYISGPLRTWLEGLAAVAGFADPFPPPPF